MNLRSTFGLTVSTLSLLLLAACGGGGGDGGTTTPSTFTIAGTATGLDSGKQVALVDNGTDSLVVSANGAFTFTTAVALNGSYAVTVGTQPTGQTCTVSNASGTGVTANVTSVGLTCSDITFTVGGTVSGLDTGKSVVLSNNGADALTVSGNGVFAFATPVALNGSYAVTVGTQPTGQTCSVASNGSASGVTANVTSVSITCSDQSFTIGGTVSGLAAGQQVTLTNNNGDPLTVTADGAFSFAAPVAFNGGYAVLVGTQPTGQTCTVTGGSNTGVTANVSNVNVACSTNTFTIGGTVSGLAGGQQVTLTNNNGDPVTVTANGAYAFATPVAFNGGYAVAVSTQPTGQICSVTGGSNSGVTANVSTANVSCSATTFTIGGSVSGLSGQVTLLNNGANATTVTANGSFAFSTPVAYNAPAVLTVGTQPVGQTCTVTPPSTVAHVTANVNSFAVTCSASTFSVSGTVLGLTTGQQVTLNNNAADPVTVTGGGTGTDTFSFATPVAYSTNYAATVGTQPTAEGCRVFAGSGTNVTANVTTVSIHCRPEVAYVVNYSDNTISQYQIAADGSLTPLAAPTVATGTTPKSIAVDPLGRFAYVANFNVAGVGSVSQYNIADADGSLTPMTVPTVTVGGTGSAPNLVAVDPSGRYVYVAAVGDSAVYQFTIGSNGALTPMGTASVPTGSGPLYMTVDPLGRYLYTGNFYDTNSTVSQFSIGNDGSLTPIGSGLVSIGANRQAYGITVDPTGTYAYVGDYGTYAQINNSMAAATPAAWLQFTIGSDGSLTATGAPVSAGSGDGPYPLVFNAAGQYGLYANYNDGTLNSCAVGVGGALTCSSYGLGSTSGLNGTGPETVSIDPSGRYVYVANQGDGTVSQNLIVPAGSTPTLNSIGTGSVAAGTSPTFIKTFR